MSLRRRAVVALALTLCVVSVAFGALGLWFNGRTLGAESQRGVSRDAGHVVAILHDHARELRHAARVAGTVPMVQAAVADLADAGDAPEHVLSDVLSMAGDADGAAILPAAPGPSASATGDLDPAGLPRHLVDALEPTGSLVVDRGGVIRIVATAPLPVGGAATGTVALSRTVDDAYLDELSSRLSLDVTVAGTADGVARLLPPGRSPQITDAGELAAEVVVADTHGRPIVEFLVDASAAGSATRRVQLGILGLTVGAAICLGVLQLRWLDRRVLRRVRQLAALVARGNEPDRPRIQLDGDDELAALAEQVERTVAERAATQDELAATAAELQHTSEAKDRYLSVLSHDLRAPLSIVQGWAETLQTRGEELDAAQREAIAASITRGTRRLDSLLRDLLTLGRARESRLVAMPERVDVDDLVRQAADDGGVHDVRVVVSAREAVWADPSHVERILANLLSNAAKYGAAPIVVETLRSPADPSAARIEVRDHGEGIPGEYEDLLFDPFTQADPCHARQGTGLGLSIVDELAALNGGAAGHERRDGQTVFWIELPVAREPAPDLRREQLPVDSR